MTATQENKQAFIDHKVITDVLPGNTELSYDLTVQWPEATLENAGVELGREETQAEPTLYLNPTVNHTPQVYCLLAHDRKSQGKNPISAHLI
jgi:hypothetical protein